MYTIHDYVTTTYDDWYKQYHVPAPDYSSKLDTVISLLQQLVDRALPRLSDGPSVDPIVVSYPTVGTQPPYQVGTVPVSVADPLAVTTTHGDGDLRLAIVNADDQSGPVPLLIKSNECLEVTSCPSKPFEIAQPVDVNVVNQPTVTVGNHINATVDGSVSVTNHLSATVDGAVSVTGAVEVSGFVGVTGVVEVINTNVLGVPVPLVIAGVTTGPPLHVTIDGDVSLEQPVSVVAHDTFPVDVVNPISISNTTPLPVEIESAPTLQVDVMNQTLVTSPIISGPIPIEASSPLPTIVMNTPHVLVDQPCHVIVDNNLHVVVDGTVYALVTNVPGTTLQVDAGTNPIPVSLDVDWEHPLPIGASGYIDGVNRHNLMPVTIFQPADNSLYLGQDCASTINGEAPSSFAQGMCYRAISCNGDFAGGPTTLKTSTY